MEDIDKRYQLINTRMLASGKGWSPKCLVNEFSIDHNMAYRHLRRVADDTSITTEVERRGQRNFVTIKSMDNTVMCHDKLWRLAIFGERHASN